MEITLNCPSLNDAEMLAMAIMNTTLYKAIVSIESYDKKTVYNVRVRSN